MKTEPEDTRIEFPSMGTTYNRPVYGVYTYGVYPRSSVLAGRTRRVFVDSFETLDEAQAAYPRAMLCVNGSCFTPDPMNDLPGEDDPQDEDTDRDFHGQVL